MGPEEFTQFHILAWWKGRESQFPVLAAMARDLLSVQASTIASESTFSTSGRVVSIRRTRLTPASLEMCICLKDHLDAAERIQHISSLEDGLEYEEQLHGVEVETGNAFSLFDEEIALDEAAIEEEDVNLEQALN
ncbi:zinc finger BED domain-containing protein RICESLEEPER 2 [Tanacetum coccineum]